MKIVTGCDAAYAPGAKALLNSIRRHSPSEQFEHWCFVYGDQALADDLAAHGFRVVLNPPYPEGAELTCGGWWVQSQMPAMYARLLIPKVFPDDARVLWLDADIIVKEPLDEVLTMDMGGHPAAGVLTADTIGSGWYPPVADDRARYGTGVLLIDVQRWNALRVTERCFDTMANPPHLGSVPRGVVETVLSHVLDGAWRVLDWRWDQNPKRRDPPPGTKIHHWGCVTPWTNVGEQGLNAKPQLFRDQAEKHWEPYR